MARAKARAGTSAAGREAADGGQSAIRRTLERKDLVAAGGVCDGVNGLLLAVSEGRGRSYERAQRGRGGEDMNEKPSVSATGRVNHAEYLNSGSRWCGHAALVSPLPVSVTRQPGTLAQR